MKLLKSFVFVSLITFFINSNVSAQQPGSITGQVFDSLGGTVTGATVIAVDAGAKEKSATTNQEGVFSIRGLIPGKYTVRVTAPKFGLYENTEVEVKAGQAEELTVALAVEAITAQVEVANDGQVSTDADNNKSATVLKGKDLDDLPDDPDELQAYLQALAGPSAGPEGGQFYIDGFTGGRLPPKEAIREIRINQNPFSAEYDRVGFGRVEILTKPGFDKFRGSVNFNFNDESLNSRNPFAQNRASSQVRNFSGFISGPIQAKKSSFFIDVQNSQNDNSALIAATILDPSLNIVNFNRDFTIPNRRFSFSPRIDYAINDSNTLVARYSFSRFTSENQGVGGFSLPSRASESSNVQHEIQLTESMIINPKTVNETRFRYEFNKREQEGDSTIPTIVVSNAFTGGGAQVGTSFNNSKRWELQNYTTTSFGKNSQHAVKFGIRVRGVNIEDRSESGYGGTFVFAGLPAVYSTPGCERANPIPAGCVVVTPAVSSIEQYRQKVLGNPDPRFNPTQFNLTAGNPLAGVSQVDYGLFFTDDWKVRPDLTISAGLRYENQTNLGDNLNFAPRLGFAWSPGAGGARQPKTVIRGAFGIFYDRFSDNFTLRSIRNNGVTQLQYIVTDPSVLGQAVFTNNGVTNVPTAAQLNQSTSTPFTIAEDLKAPYAIQSVFSVERTLPYRSNVAFTFFNSRSLHTLRQRNINAPVCPTPQTCPTDPAQIQLLRPNRAAGNIYQIESSGYADTQQFLVRFMTRLNPKITLFTNYSLGRSKGTTDSLSGAGIVINTINFPAYSYDLSGEYAPSAFIPRHSFFLGGSLTMPWAIRVSPTVIVSSGRRFNIVSGLDTNRDSVFTERPTYSALNARCQALGLNNEFCNTDGISDPTNTIIPRNYGKGPGTFIVNMNLSRTFGFGKSNRPPVGTTRPQTPDAQAAGNSPAAGGGGRRGGNPSAGGGNRGGGGNVVVGGGGGGGGGGFFGGGETGKPYNLTVGVNIRNIFNTVNFSAPVGSLSSPNFGRSLGIGGGFGPFGGGDGSANRRVDLSLRFSF